MPDLTPTPPEKNYTRSTTLQGATTMMVTSALMFLPIDLPEGWQGQIAQAVTVLFWLIGFGMTIVGRLKAKATLT